MDLPERLFAAPVAGLLPVRDARGPLRVLVAALAPGGAERIVLEWLEAEAVRGRPVELAALAQERFILRESGSGSRRTLDTHLAQMGLKLDVKLTVNSNEAICDLVASGMGLTVVSRFALPPDPAAAGLCLLDVAGFPLRRPWRVVHLRSKILSLPAQAFVDYLLHGRQADAPLAAADGFRAETNSP